MRVEMMPKECLALLRYACVVGALFIANVALMTALSYCLGCNFLIVILVQYIANGAIFLTLAILFLPLLAAYMIFDRYVPTTRKQINRAVAFAVAAILYYASLSALINLTEIRFGLPAQFFTPHSFYFYFALGHSAVGGSLFGSLANGCDQPK